MKDDDPERNALRQLISTAAEICTDTSILDLVYQLLTYENSCKEAE
jgi:hypothetical protein